MDGEHERGPLGDGLKVVQLGVESEVWLRIPALMAEAGRFGVLAISPTDIGLPDGYRTRIVGVLIDEIFQPFPAKLDRRLGLALEETDGRPTGPFTLDSFPRSLEDFSQVTLSHSQDAGRFLKADQLLTFPDRHPSSLRVCVAGRVRETFSITVCNELWTRRILNANSVYSASVARAGVEHVSRLADGREVSGQFLHRFSCGLVVREFRSWRHTLW